MPCRDIQTGDSGIGKPLWKVSLGPVTKGGMGPGTSPVIVDDLVILQYDQELGEGSFIAALDKRKGKEVWRVPRTNRRSWATPIVVEAAGRPELIAAGAESVIAYDPRTGRKLWRANGTESHAIPSAVAADGLVFFTAGSSKKRALAIRPGGNGDLTIRRPSSGGTRRAPRACRRRSRTATTST